MPVTINLTKERLKEAMKGLSKEKQRKILERLKEGFLQSYVSANLEEIIEEAGY